MVLAPDLGGRQKPAYSRLDLSRFSGLRSSGADDEEALFGRADHSGAEGVGGGSEDAGAVPDAANVSWSMDFVADGLAGGRKLRCLVIVDDCTRECLVIEVDTSLTGRRVVAVLESLADTRGLP
jgi:transposase InsO family protein